MADRRKIVHRRVPRVIQTLASTEAAIDEQQSSGNLAGWPDVTNDVLSMKTMLSSQRAILQAWYDSWRGSEPPEVPDSDYLGVFGTFNEYENRLKNTDDIPRLARSDYAAMSAVAMAYTELYSLAVAVGNDAAGLKSRALDGLKAAIPIIESLSETVCRATVRELNQEDPSIPMSAANTAVTKTQEAWNS